MNLDSLELLLQSEEIPLPTGIETEIGAGYPTLDLSKYGDLFRIGRRSVQLRPSQIPLLVQFLNEVNSLGGKFNVEWEKTNKARELNESLKKIIDKHNLFLINTKSKAAKDNAIKNYNMSKMYKIASNPVNLIEASQSVDSTTGEPKQIANTSEIALDQRTHTYGNFANKALAIIENQVGKKCVGISANGLKGFFALFQYYSIVLNDPTISDDEKWKRLGFLKTIETFDRQNPTITKKWRKQLLANVIKFTPAKNRYLAEAIAGIDQDTDAAIILSAILSLATDNAKELSLAKLNAGVNMLGIYVYGTMIGIDFKGLSDIMMSTPALIVRDLMEGNSFGINLKLSKLDQVFDYLELGPKKQLQALGKTFEIKVGENVTTVSTLSIVEDAIRKAFSDYAIEQESFENFLAKLAKEHPDELAKKLDILEEIKTNLYNKYNNQSNGAKGAWYITRLIDFIQEYMIQVNEVIGTYETQVNYTSLKQLAYGAMEIRVLGQMLALNQGLPSSPRDAIAKIAYIEQIINRRQSQLNRANFREHFFTHGEFKRMPKKKDLSFSLIRFVNEEDYRKRYLALYNAAKDTFNILEVMTTDPQYFQYLSELAELSRISRLPVKTRALLRGVELAVAEQEAYDLKDIQDITKATEDLIGKYLIDSWLLSTPQYGQFVLPAGQYLYTRDYKGRIKRSKEKTTTAKTIQLGTQEGNDTFVKYMETYVIPRVKAGKDKSNRRQPALRENQFLQALKPLVFNQLNADRSPRMGYSLPINMMPRTPDEVNEHETLKESLYKLTGEEYQFGNYNLFNLFYLYNLLAFDNKRTETTLTSLFDQTTQDIVKSKNAYINEFDVNEDSTKEISFEDGDKVSKSKANITKTQLTEATRLIRSPYSSELRHIYAPDPLEFGYQPYDRIEKVHYTQEEYEAGIAEEAMQGIEDEYENGAVVRKGNYQRVNKIVNINNSSKVTIAGAKITHTKGVITEIKIEGKSVKIPNFTRLITTQYQQGNQTIVIVDMEANRDIIENYKNNCGK